MRKLSDPSFILTGVSLRSYSVSHSQHDMDVRLPHCWSYGQKGGCMGPVRASVDSAALNA